MAFVTDTDTFEAVAEEQSANAHQKSIALAKTQSRQFRPAKPGKNLGHSQCPIDRVLRCAHIPGINQLPGGRSADIDAHCAGGGRLGSVGSLTLRSRSHPSFSIFMCSIAMPLAFASSSGS